MDLAEQGFRDLAQPYTRLQETHLRCLRLSRVVLTLRRMQAPQR